MALFVAAFDIATSTGACDGFAGGKPRLWTWRLDNIGDGRPRRLAYLRAFVDSYLAGQKVDRLFYEAPLALGAIMSAKKDSGFVVSDEQLSFLRGAIGVVESCAAMANVPVEAISVQDARAHFCGQRRFPKENGKSTAKQHVMRMCKTLGIPALNSDEADAAALWSYGCAVSNPRVAHLHSPLFAAR